MNTDTAPSNGTARVARSTDLSTTTVWWFDGRGASDPDLWAAVERSNCQAIVAAPAQLDTLRGQKQRIAFVEREGELAWLPPDVWVLTPDDRLRAAASAAGHHAGLLIE